jgi:curved DNA-binding protein CbpA
MNYYEVLEVPHDAPQHEIHKAYQRAKATYAQDNPALYSMFTREEARDLMKLVDEAYGVLGNHALRRNYDETLLKSGLRNMNPVVAPNPTHDSLPDFVVPDPSIPGSFDEAPDYSMPAVQPLHIAPVTPPAPSMDPLHASATGVRESILVTNSEFTVRKRETAAPLPADTGRCPLGTYKIDLAMEQEIATATTFDGLFLQKIRLYKQVSLEKLSVSSRIGKTYLIALESNDFKNLPATVFLRGFLVQMAKQLGLDETKVVTSYMNLAKAGLPSKYGP